LGASATEIEPPVSVAPEARVMAFVTVRLFRSSVPAAATLTAPVPSEPVVPILTVPVLMVVPPV